MPNNNVNPLPEISPYEQPPIPPNDNQSSWLGRIWEVIKTSILAVIRAIGNIFSSNKPPTPPPSPLSKERVSKDVPDQADHTKLFKEKIEGQKQSPSQEPLPAVKEPLKAEEKPAAEAPKAEKEPVKDEPKASKPKPPPPKGPPPTGPKPARVQTQVNEPAPQAKPAPQAAKAPQSEPALKAAKAPQSEPTPLSLAPAQSHALSSKPLSLQAAAIVQPAPKAVAGFTFQDVPDDGACLYHCMNIAAKKAGINFKGLEHLNLGPEALNKPKIEASASLSKAAEQSRNEAVDFIEKHINDNQLKLTPEELTGRPSNSNNRENAFYGALYAKLDSHKSIIEDRLNDKRTTLASKEKELNQLLSTKPLAEPEEERERQDRILVITGMMENIRKDIPTLELNLKNSFNDFLPSAKDPKNHAGDAEIIALAKMYNIAVVRWTKWDVDPIVYKNDKEETLIMSETLLNGKVLKPAVIMKDGKEEIWLPSVFENGTADHPKSVIQIALVKSKPHSVRAAHYNVVN